MFRTYSKKEIKYIYLYSSLFNNNNNFAMATNTQELQESEQHTEKNWNKKQVPTQKPNHIQSQKYNIVEF